MQTLAEIKSLLEARGLRPKRSLGQNFLVDHNLIKKLVDASGVGAGDLVLEIGPGTGTMTEELLARGCEVIACELDDQLADLLRERFEDELRFALVHNDCLHPGAKRLSDPLLQRLDGRPFSLVANLPYGCATPVMATLVCDHPECATLAVTIQREAGERLWARTGEPEYGWLAVVAQAGCEVERLATLPGACFWPRPDVDSVMALLRRRADVETEGLVRLREGCRRIFAQRRKQLGRVLGRDIPWPDGVEPTMRAQELPVDRVIALADALDAMNRTDG